MKEKRFKKIYVEITNICNLKCSFCPETNREKKYMEIESFENILKKVKPYTNLIALHIKGEPLLHPNLNEILKICEKEKIKVNITTNGTLLKSNVENILSSKSVRQINISVHSALKNKNMEKSLEIFLEDIFKAIDEIKNRSNIIISYRMWNLKALSENADDKNMEIIKKMEEKYKIHDLETILGKNMFFKLEENVFINQDFEFKWPDINGDIISETGNCRGLTDQIGILVNGDVIPCCLDQEGDIKLGNLLNEDLEEIINSDIAQDILKGFRENKLIHNLCKRCGFRSKFQAKR